MTLKKTALCSLLATWVYLPALFSAEIAFNFESETADDTAPPSGWSLVSTAGTATYKVTSAGLGSNGSGGSAGLAGQVSSDAYLKTNLPGGYLVNNTVFDVTQNITGSFDIYALNEATSDDVVMVFGNIGSGFAGNTKNDFLSAKFLEGSGDDVLADSDNTSLNSYTTPGFTNDTWVHATFSWTPTSGNTGNFSITLKNFGPTTISELSKTGYTFTSSAAQFGFGSVNDTVRFDNIYIIPEPASLALFALGLSGLLGLSRFGSRSSGASTKS